MTPLPFSAKKALSQVACLHDADRSCLHALLGAPHFTEQSDSRTYGGEEDWWAYETSEGYAVVLSLRVPYRNAVVMTDAVDSKIALDAFSKCLKLGRLEVYDRPYLV